MSDFNELVPALSTLTIALCLLWAYALNLSRNRSISNFLFSLILILNAASVIALWIACEYQIVGCTAIIIVLRWTVFPIFLFYVSSLITPDWKFRPIYLLHFVPAMILSLYFGIALHWLPHWEAWALSRIISFRWATVVISTLYLAVALTLIHRRIQRRHQIVSDPDSVQIHWLILLRSLVIGIWIAQILEVIYLPTDACTTPLRGLVFNIGLWAITAYALKYSSVIRSDRVYDELPPKKAWQKTERLAELVAGCPHADSPSRTSLSDSEIELAAKSLRESLQTTRDYRQPNYKIGDLARLARRPVYQTSEIINRGLKLSFFELINQLRIEDAIGLLRDPKSIDKTILEIAIEVGYNSKSAFNSAFKKITHKTPSQFRERSAG